MVVMYGLALGFGVGWLRGGRLGELRHWRFRLGGLVLPAALLQALVIGARIGPWSEPGSAGVLLMISYLLLMGFILVNRRLPEVDAREGAVVDDLQNVRADAGNLACEAM